MSGKKEYDVRTTLTLGSVGYKVNHKKHNVKKRVWLWIRYLNVPILVNNSLTETAAIEMQSESPSTAAASSLAQKLIQGRSGCACQSIPTCPFFSLSLFWMIDRSPFVEWSALLLSFPCDAILSPLIWVFFPAKIESQEGEYWNSIFLY